MRMTRLGIHACALLLLMGWGVLQPTQGLAAAKPNIVFIMADDLGYGDLGCYGQEILQTPNIDELAAQGMRFTDFYAGSTVCAPSRCVLMTGLHTGHCHIRGNARHPLRPEDVTVAELLGSAGYRCGLFGKWGLGEEGSTGAPIRQGFDEFFGYLNQRHAHNYYPEYLFRGDERVPLKNVVQEMGEGSGVATKKVQYSADLILDEALGFLEDAKESGEPFFLYYPTTLPHANNEARRAVKNGAEVPTLDPYAERDWDEQTKGHAAMVTYLDTQVGTLLDKLDELGLRENTVVFFTSDNGPHAETGHDPEFFDANGPLRGIKRDLYDGGIRVPMIVRWPGKTPAGSKSDYIGYFADFLPTAAAIAGAEAPKDIDGISFVPAIKGNEDEQPEHEALYWEFYERGSAQAVRMGPWKGVAKPFGGPIELYDVTKDPDEDENVAKQHPEVVAKIAKIMKQAHEPHPLWQLPKQAKQR